jgi:hypothetical protein
MGQLDDRVDHLSRWRPPIPVVVISDHVERLLPPTQVAVLETFPFTLGAPRRHGAKVSPRPAYR